MKKENFYVITGGPGAGKSSLLEILALRGYHSISETAREIIKQRLSDGLSARPDPAIFAQQIFDKDFGTFISITGLTSPVFFDRSFLDAAWQLFNAHSSAYHKIKDLVIQHGFNKQVFILPPWEDIYVMDAERDHSFQESVEIYQSLTNWYIEHNYEIVTVPKAPIEERVNFILQHIMPDPASHLIK